MINKNIFLLAVTCLLFSSCAEDSVDENIFGTLTGKVVTEGDNIPLSNVKITSNPVSTTVFTDTDGNFIIEEVQVGEYAFQAELSDFQISFEAVNILEEKTLNVVFEMDSLSLSNLAPTTPLLLFPEDGTENILAETEFIWSSGSNDTDEITYELELRNGTTNIITIIEEIKDTTYTVNDLSIGHNYFWQISANDGVNEVTESAISGFVTKGNDTNRFLYVRNVDGNNIIFSGGEPTANEDDDDDEVNDDDANQNELQLTNSNLNSYRPIKNQTLEKIAFLRTVGAETHLFVMNSDGTNLVQVTKTVPVVGFRQNELEFAWYANGSRIYYANFNKLYSISADGSDLQLEYEVADNIFISEIAISPASSLVAIKTNNNVGYAARIVLVNVNSNFEETVIISGQLGALGGLDFSIDATKILYTRDVSGAENTEYRQLDSSIFEYTISTATAVEIDTDKLGGTNDLDSKYAPDEGSIIFVNTSNDGISERRIYRTDEDTDTIKELLFTDAFMPNWE